MTEDLEGVGDGPQNQDNKDIPTGNNKPLLSSDEMRNLLGQNYSIESLRKLVDDWLLIPDQFCESAIQYFQGAIREYGPQSVITRELNLVLKSIFNSGKRSAKTQTMDNQSAEVDGITIDIKKTQNKDGNEVVDLHETAKELKEKFHFVVLKDRKNRAVDMFCYDPKSGIYRNDAKDMLNMIVEQLFKNSAVTNLKNELYAHVRDQGFEYLDKWMSKGEPHVVVSNGVISLAKVISGEYPLEPWSPDIHSLNKLDVGFDPNAPDSLFVGHLQTVIPDESDRDRFHRFVGSFLETDAYAHQKILILFGVEGSGKTVTLRTFSKFFGTENIAAKSFQQLAENRFAIADLAFVMANICEELPQSAIKQIEKLNSLTGGLVDGERKNRDPFTFYQNAKIAVACNDLPELSGDTTTIRAFMSRVIIIVFDRTIRDTPQDIKNFDDVLLQQKSGILNWILAGYKKYIQGDRKIDSSKSTDQTLEFYIANSDFMAYFIKGCTLKGTPQDYVIKEELWQAYLQAARKIGAATVTRQTFLQNFPMKFTLGAITSERVKVRGRQEHVFSGILLRPENQWFIDVNEQNDDAKQDTESKDGNLGNEAANIEKYGISDTKHAHDTANQASVNKLPELPAHVAVSGNESQSFDKNQNETSNSNAKSEIVFRRVTNLNPILNPNPQTFTRRSVWRMSRQQAEDIGAYNFTEELPGEEAHKIQEGEIHDLRGGE